MQTTDKGFNPSGLVEVDRIKQAFEDVERVVMDNAPKGRRRSIALTHLETAAMFAVKAAVVGDE